MLTGTRISTSSFWKLKIFRWMIRLSGNEKRFGVDEIFLLFTSLFTIYRNSREYLQHHQRHYLQYLQVS